MLRDFRPSQPTIPDFFSGTRFYKIPKYQRPYTWSEEKVEDLWYDLLNNEAGHYLGVVVLKFDRLDGTYDIIDGQQRLTTLTMFIALMRNLFEIASDNNTATQLQDLIARKAYKNSGPVLKVGTHIKSFFGEYFQDFPDHHHQDILDGKISIPLNAESEQLIKNYKKLTKLITEHQDYVKDPLVFLNRIKDTFDETQILALTVENEDDAFILFETLNYKLARLSEIDLIKNRIFMSLTPSMSEQEIEKNWDDLVNNIGGEKRDLTKLDTYLKYFWWSRYDKSPPSKIFKELRSANVVKVFDELITDSIHYKPLIWQNQDKLIRNGRDFTEIRDVAKWLNLRQVNILLLSLIRKMSEPNAADYAVPKVNHLLKLLCKFVIAYKYSKRSPSAVERKYSKHAVAIHNAKNKTEMDNVLTLAIKDFSEEFPLPEEFFDNFNLEYRNKDSDNNNLVAYLLEKVMFPGDEFTLKETDIEHIFPQRPEGGFAATEKHIGQNIHHLGNLSPLGKKINQQECGNLRPIEKIEFYAHSSVPMIKDEVTNIIKKQGWSAEVIEVRTNELKTKIWDYLSAGLEK